MIVFIVELLYKDRSWSQYLSTHSTSLLMPFGCNNMCITWLPPCGWRRYYTKGLTAIINWMQHVNERLYCGSWMTTDFYHQPVLLLHYCALIERQAWFISWLWFFNICLSVCGFFFRKSPGEGGVEVAPTPAARPSLRDMHSPQPHAKSTIEEDVKRHSTPDSPPPPRRHKEKVHLQACLSI